MHVSSCTCYVGGDVACKRHRVDAILVVMWRACDVQDRGSNSLLSPEDLKRIVGPGAHDAHGKGNVNVGDGGVAFLLASSGAIPGGAPLVSHHPAQHASGSCCAATEKTPNMSLHASRSCSIDQHIVKQTPRMSLHITPFIHARHCSA